MKNHVLILLLFFGLSLSAQDQIDTQNGPLTVHPILHGSLVLTWNSLNIIIDPYGGGALYEAFKPDLILITDIHGDHYNPKTLNELDKGQATFITPEAVAELVSVSIRQKTSILANRQKIEHQGITITAIPMYNLPETADSRHPKGRGNGYLLELGGKRIYISGDTEDIKEMRNLKNIDVAFVCMNLPYTMDINQAADAVVEFAPKVVYPYHYRGGGGTFSDVAAFKSLVNNENENIEVRLRDWYGK